MLKLLNEQDTICAVATAPGMGAIAIIRVSGPEALIIGRKVARFIPSTPESHRAFYGHLLDPDSNVKIDEVIALYFAQDKSFTGEQTIEFFTHGSPIVTQKVLMTLIRVGARAAEPGEFSYRAFKSGRIDLTQAEAIQQLIGSKSESAHNLALRQLSGELSFKLRDIEERLIWGLSRLEANIDFAQEDIEFAAAEEIFSAFKMAGVHTKSLLQTYKHGRAIQQGIKVVLVGKPNVGKSSLLNAILQQDRAIVSPIPGTTRDCVVGTLNYKGVQMDFVDTAGLHNTEDYVEQIGIQKTREAIRDADVVLFLKDQSAPPSSEDLDPFFEIDDLKRNVIHVWTKSDLPIRATIADNSRDSVVSAMNGSGISALLDRISSDYVRASEKEDATLINARHFEELSKADFHISIATQLLSEGASAEFIISEAQEALFAVMRILGKQFDDEITDKIFRDFCLGK